MDIRNDLYGQDNTDQAEIKTKRTGQGDDCWWRPMVVKTCVGRARRMLLDMSTWNQGLGIRIIWMIDTGWLRANAYLFVMRQTRFTRPKKANDGMLMIAINETGIVKAEYM